MEAEEIRSQHNRLAEYLGQPAARQRDDLHDRGAGYRRSGYAGDRNRVTARVTPERNNGRPLFFRVRVPAGIGPLPLP